MITPTPDPTPASGKDELRDKISMYVESAYLHGLPTENLDTGEFEPPRDISDVAWITDKIMQLIAQQNQQARIQAASDIFSLAHKYAQEDKTMHGAEELRAYHYFNAITKIGEFDGR